MKAALGIVVVVALAAVVRLVALAADPPVNFGAAHLTDEGYYSKNAKERLRSGSWTHSSDNHNHVYLAPLTILANVAGMALGRSDLVTVRRVAALLSLLSLGCLVAYTLHSAGAVAGLIAATILALDPALVALGRTALAEGPLCLATAVFAVALSHDLDRRWPWLTWFAFVVAMLVKASAIVLMPVTALALLQHTISRRRWTAGLLSAGRLLGGLVLLTAAWRWGYVGLSAGASFMYDYEYGAHLADDSPWNPLTMLLRSVQTKHVSIPFSTNPVLAALAVVGVAVVLLEVMRARPTSRLELVMVSWLVATGMFFSATPYQPPRYFLALAAPAAVLAASILADPALWWQRIRGAFRGSAIVFLILFAVTLATTLKPVLQVSRSVLFAVAILTTVAFTACLHRGQRVAALLILLVFPAFTLVGWATHPTYSIRDTSDDLSQRLSAGDVVVGYFADTLTLASSARSIVIHGPWNPLRVDQLSVTHLLVRSEELRWLQDRDPTLLHRLDHIARYSPQQGVRGELELFAVQPAR